MRSDRLLVRAGATPTVRRPALVGNGFLFDDVTTTSSHVNNPAPLNPPAPGPQGPKGDTGNDWCDGCRWRSGCQWQERHDRCQRRHHDHP